jgi:transcriptional regulator with GAF, ATPase, and Fis domain
LYEKLKNHVAYLKEELVSEKGHYSIITRHSVFLSQLKQLEKVAKTTVPVLITGETGVGKELVANLVHQLSERDGEYVSINTSAIPDNLLESEFFGYEKGAFTGAVKSRIGKFELAHKGTLFLDEIGEMPDLLQPKLLRVIQEGEVPRLGGNKNVNVDVRIVAATNCDLKEEIEQKRFREDLYYRLNVFQVVIPPLRERIEDIPLLVEFFISKFSKRYKKRIRIIPEDTIKALKQYNWPGNVRELENVVERAVIISESDVLTIDNILPVGHLEADLTARNLMDIEKDHILKVLEETSWKISGSGGAAEVLGLKRTTLNAKMKKLGIQKKQNQ